MGGVLTLAAGLMALHARWNFPRAMRRAKAKAAARGTSTEKIDTMLASRRWQVASTLLLATGVLGVVAGVALLVTEQTRGAERCFVSRYVRGPRAGTGAARMQ